MNRRRRFNLTALWSGLCLLLFSWAFSQDSDSDSSAVETSTPVIKYIPVPANVNPLEALLPSGGIGQRGGALMPPPRGKVHDHEIDFTTREIAIQERYVNPLSRDTAHLSSSYYPELAVYVMDMYDIGLNRLWLNSLIGQRGEGHDVPDAGSLFDISIPINMPAWMKDFGFDKPKLLLQGSMDIRLKGYGEIDNAPGSSKNSLFPSPSLHYDASFMVKGKIGPYVTVEVTNMESGLGVKNQIRVVYEESFKDEFEDYILQRVEAGNTSLALTGTELTGYSENHKGLFGIKTEWKLGDWRLTAIASQDGGSQESYTLNASESTSEFQIQDKQFVAYRYYFLNHEARTNYINTQITGKTNSPYSAANLKLYRRVAINQTNNVLRDIVVVYKAPSGAVIEKTVERMEEVPPNEYSYDSKTSILKVSGMNRSSLIAASWSNDGTGRTGTTIRNGSKIVLIQWDANLSELEEIDRLMLRNVYTVGDASSSNFIVRLKDKSGNTGDYLKQLGIVDSVTGTPKISDMTIFKKDASGAYTGEMWLPCRPVSSYSGPNAVQKARENCLEPFRIIDTSATLAQLYNLPVYNLSRYTSRYYFESVGKRRSSTISVRDQNSSYSINSGSCMDISPGTEKLKAGSQVLERDRDYSVNYELGQIELLSERALDPNQEITVTFECEPLFEIDNKVLLGARAELPLDLYGFGTGSVFGLTALYKSQSISAEMPTLGNEPYSSFLWGINLRLQDTASWMTNLINRVPLIDTRAVSGWRFETEFASSFHNTNTSDRKSASIEDFENTTNGLLFPMSRLMWYYASPPGGTDSDSRTLIENQDFRHKGEFIWHSNNTELYKYIYPTVGNSDVDNQRLPILKFTLRPNDNLSGNSWGGIMRSNSVYYQDLSNKKYIEVVARGNVGSLYLDLGLISEDLSINGYAPNGMYDGENNLGTTIVLHDKGLDGLSGSEETRLEWDCRIAGCVPTTYSSINSDLSNADIARDNFNDNLSDDSDPPVSINGTENNSGERAYDTEDINRNGSLDTDISFVRYRIDLSSTDKTEYEELKNGWRKWRIPLDQFDTIVSPGGASVTTILSEALFSRLWYGSLNQGIAEGKVQIASLSVMGNAWEENGISSLYATSSEGNTQIVDAGGSETEISSSVSLKDSAYLQVSTIDNRENAGLYFKSPNTTTERDTETNATLKETALVLHYKDLSPGQVVGATRIFETDIKDLTAYKTIKMEIHYATEADRVPVRFALQFGTGSLDGSSDYYEWSFRPANYECTSSQRLRDCHEENWLANAFSKNLSEFTNMKRGRKPPFLEPVIVDLGGAREEQLKLVGNPSASSIDWIRFVIIADDNATPNELEGEFWVNDLRLSQMDNAWGYAFRTSAQADFADVLTVSGAARYQDGDFATLSGTGSGSPKPKLSEAATQLDIAGDASLNVNKFFKDEHGFRMPLSVGYSSVTQRPYLKPTDDLELSHDNLGDLGPEFFKNDLKVTSLSEEEKLRAEQKSKGYQTFSQNKSISFSYMKEYVHNDNAVQEYLGQFFLERPAFSYSYNENETKSSTNADSTYSYRTTIEYRLGSFNRFDYKPFQFLDRFSWAKPLAGAAFEPWPQTFDVTLFDLTYIRYIDQDRDPNFTESQTERVLSYTVDLTHRLNMRWNILPFFHVSYNMQIDRDMYGGGDKEAFTKENFFSTKNGSLFAANEIFDFDHTDRRVYISVDSVVAIPYDTIPAVTPGGDTLVMDIQNPSTYQVLYDSTTFYKVDSLGQKVYGKSYGILRNERARNQQFQVSFTPNIIVFLPMNFSFNSAFNQQKSIPDNFNFYDQTQLEKNFWTISQTNRFEFSPSFKMVEFSKLFGNTNPVANFLEKIRWREIKAVWTTNINTIGEDFTLAQLYEDQGVTPLQYYLYGLGIGNGYRNRGLWNIVSGDMGLTHRDDFTGFGEYRNRNVDTLVYQQNFMHSVSRSLQISSGLTLPFWNIAVVGDMQWKQEFQQSREYPMYLDSVLTWPKWGVGVNIPNFSQRVGFLNSFRSVSSSHRVDYTRIETVRPFQSTEDSWQTTWRFNPLIRLSFLLQNNMRIENGVTLTLDYQDRRAKEEVISQTDWPNAPPNVADTSKYYLYTPWIHTSLYRDFGIDIGDNLTISYPLKTKRGFQFWKWYFKLENDIDLRLTAGYEYKKTIREAYEPVAGYDMWNKESGTDGVYREWNINGVAYTVYKPELEKIERTIPVRSHEWFIRPNAGYDFNKMASMSAYIEYRQIHEKLDDETSHRRQILTFEIALLLRFN